MGKFRDYNISLRNLPEGVHEYDYLLDNQFFKLINDSESDIKKGSVSVNLTVKSSGNVFEFNFSLSGEVLVPCDRCLDDMPMEVVSKSRMFVKFGLEYSEESDEIVVIPEEEGAINIAWFLYEFIMLSLPIKRVHPSGKCNRLMSSKLNKHRAVSTDDINGDDSDSVDDDFDSSDDTDSPNEDPRWDSLKDISLEE